MQHQSRFTAGFSMFVGTLVLVAATTAQRPGDVSLASLDLARMRVQIVAGGRGGAPPANVAHANKAIDGRAIRIGGKEFAEGVGTRATSVLFVNLAGGAARFTAMVGVDDNAPPTPASGATAPTTAPPPTPIVFRPVRAPDGTMLTNKKFPNMKSLGDYIHAKGFQFGIYSGPGPTTCQRLEASWQHELQDFQTFASWGVDYLKYDWCGYSSVLATGEINTQLPVLKRPYQVARTALNQVKRDIIYSLCQYGWGNVWEWGAEKGIEGNSWRTTGDITDTWESMNGIGFRQVGNSKYASPGHWNDPDMLVIGKVGWGPRLRDSELTANEQYIHITLWTLLASPLLLGNDLTQMDDFELNLVTNDEVLAVHQDPLGKPADRVARNGELEVWSRPLTDGSLAVGLFNRDEMDMPVSVKWSELGIKGKHTVRDLWRQKDVGKFDGEFSRVIPRHGTLFVKVSL